MVPDRQEGESVPNILFVHCRSADHRAYRWRLRLSAPAPHRAIGVCPCLDVLVSDDGKKRRRRKRNPTLLEHSTEQDGCRRLAIARA
ncbi:MAG: hypothetical protein ABFD79_02715 [Phycisphaerales bacterium]